MCCAYGADGKKTSGYDCVLIRGAAKFTANEAMIAGGAFCGRKGLASATNGNTKTICSKADKLF